MKRRGKEDNLYTELQRQSLEMIQQLSGNLWTDFNEHDPGVTLMDAFHYALVEMSYQQEFDFEEYLGSPKGNLHYEKAGFLPANEIFAPLIVTPDDYENLFKEQIPEISGCKVSVSETNYYTITIDLKEDANEKFVREIVFKLYHAHRNLAENLSEIRIDNLGKKQSDSFLKKKDIIYKQNDEVVTIKKKIYTADYHSVQYDLPDCYATNERGLPPQATEERKAQALQLKAYLLQFDYLLSAMNQQRKNIHSLFQLSGELAKPFSFEMDIAELNRLIDKDRIAGSVIFDPTEINKQKESYFDFLDVIYGEDTHIQGEFTREMASLVYEIRARLIRNFPTFNTNRFRSFDITDKTVKSIPTIKQMLVSLCGYEQNEETPLINVFGRYNLRLISDDSFYNDLQELLKIEFIVVQDKNMLETISETVTQYDKHDFQEVRKKIHLLWNNIIFEGLLKYGMHLKNYKIYPLMEKGGCLLLFRQPDKTEWINMGFFFEKEALIKSANYLSVFIDKLYRESISFYLVEHILLSQNSDDNREKILENNTISIIIPDWIDKDKTNLQEMIEERMPAHLCCKTYFFEAEIFFHFEKNYFQWRKALDENDEITIEELSKQIRKEINGE